MLPACPYWGDITQRVERRRVPQCVRASVRDDNGDALVRGESPQQVVLGELQGFSSVRAPGYPFQVLDCPARTDTSENASPAPWILKETLGTHISDTLVREGNIPAWGFGWKTGKILGISITYNATNYYFPLKNI